MWTQKLWRFITVFFSILHNPLWLIRIWLHNVLPIFSQLPKFLNFFPNFILFWIQLNLSFISFVFLNIHLLIFIFRTILNLFHGVSLFTDNWTSRRDQLILIFKNMTCGHLQIVPLLFIFLINFNNFLIDIIDIIERTFRFKGFSFASSINAYFHILE